MKRVAPILATLILAILACGLPTNAKPTPDIHAIETMAVQTMTASAPTRTPWPTLPTARIVTHAPTETFVPVSTATRVTRVSVANATPIRFQPGGVSGTVNWYVSYKYPMKYILRAFGNQQMTISLVSPNDVANFSVVGASYSEPLKTLDDESHTWTGVLPATQDYLISIYVAEGSTSFTLTVTIIGP